MEKEGDSDIDLFVIDTTPKVKSDAPIPKYKSKFQVLSDTPEDDEPAKKKPKRKGFLQNCFNCGSNEHSIRDCPEPRNHREIAKNRRQFLEAKNGSKNGFVFQRYHVDDEQRYSHFKPGTISKNLQHALGITSYQLPPYIYNMRILGYPLGWLEEIKVSHSGIAMFDGNGKEVANPDDEEGEIVNPGDRDKYDLRKIISYPGFNVPASSKTIDEYERYDAPPQNGFQSKENLTALLQKNAQVPFQSQKSLSTIKDECTRDNYHSNTDMDVEDTPEVGLLPDDNCGFVPPLPDVAQPPPPPEDIPCVDDKCPETPKKAMDGDLSLQDLESKKSELLAELNDTSATNTPPHKNLGKIKTVELGTPVLKSVSPYSRLPSADSFSIDICDVINFENLPDSTGKYEKMSGLINKVRSKVSKLQSRRSN